MTLVEEYQKWVKLNVSPECTNRDCLRVDRGSCCYRCYKYQHRTIDNILETDKQMFKEQIKEANERAEKQWKKEGFNSLTEYMLQKADIEKEYVNDPHTCIDPDKLQAWLEKNFIPRKQVETLIKSEKEKAMEERLTGAIIILYKLWDNSHYSIGKLASDRIKDEFIELLGKDWPAKVGDIVRDKKGYSKQIKELTTKEL